MPTQKERRQKKHYLSQILAVIDDMSDAYELQARRENPVSRLYYGGRHWGISVISSVHASYSFSASGGKRYTKKDSDKVLKVAERDSMVITHRETGEFGDEEVQ